MRAVEFNDIRILIIDDTGHGRSLLRRLLTQLKLTRIVALSSTEEALIVLREEFFDVVFCDETVGPIDAVDFMKTLRHDLATLDITIPVILVSGGVSRRQIEHARDAGINDIIAKPVSAERVERKLRSLIMAPQIVVVAKTFLGPDRRRSGSERRQFGDRSVIQEHRGERSEGVGVFV